MNVFEKVLPPRWRAKRSGLYGVKPRALLHPDARLLVLWSAKSACTTTFVWFARVSGQLEALRASGKKPHKFRAQDYYGSELHRRGLEIPLGEYRIVQIIRDPYSRAVSSYRHALNTGYEDERLASSAVGPLDRWRGFSFSRFLDYLETLDLDEANPHHKPQWHPIDADRVPDRIINISRQNLFAELNGAEAEFGLPHTPFDELDWLHAFEGKRKAKEVPFDGADVPDTPFDEMAARGDKPWPKYGQFLTEPIRRRIETLYARDFEGFAGYL